MGKYINCPCPACERAWRAAGAVAGPTPSATPTAAPPPFRLETDWPGLNEVWNTPDSCEGEHHGPWVVLAETNQRRCLRCLYMDAFLQGVARGGDAVEKWLEVEGRADASMTPTIPGVC
jgi:hypothetical protein